MAIIKKGNIYQAVFKENGKSKWRSLRTRHREEAEIRHAELLKQRHAERFGLPKSPQDIAMPDLIKEFIRLKRGNGLAESTLTRNSIVLDTAERVLGVRFASDWSAQKLESYKQMRAEEVAASTLNREIVTLKDFLRQAKQWNYSVPTIDEIDRVEKVKNPRRPPLFYTTEQIAEIIDGIEPFWVIAALLGGVEGLRRDESLHLRWADVDFAAEVIRVVSRDEWQTKNRKSRVLPLFGPLAEPLRAWKAACNGTEMVLPWTKTPIDFTREFTRLLRRKGFKKGSYHTMRHSFASNLARAGVNLKLISELLGHASMSTTAIYAHFLPSDLADSMKKLPDPLALLKRKQEERE